MTMKVYEAVATFGNQTARGFYGPGYVGFTVRKRDFVAAGIQWFERWDAIVDLPCPSHTFIITGLDSTVEAFGDGVHSGTLTHYLTDPDVALLIRRPMGWTPDLGARIVAAADRRIGKKYGYWLIAGMAISNSFAGRALSWLTRGWFTRKVNALFDSRSTEICSGLVAESLQEQPELAGVGCLKEPHYTLKPVDLFTDGLAFEPDAVELLPTDTFSPLPP